MKSLSAGSSHVQHRPPSVALLLQQEIGSGPHLGCCPEPREDTLLVSAHLGPQLSAVHLLLGSSWSQIAGQAPQG